ncbi:hypothetical protein Tco_1228862 [Tanacetum coccineum]
MRELREDTFSGNKNDDAYEHVERFLNIVSLFNIPGVTHDAVMLRVFPITLTGAAKRYCPPSSTAKQLEEIYNFKQEGDETLYQAWERSTSMRVSNDSLAGIAAITNKLDSLGRDMKKLKENVHAIQIGCENCYANMIRLAGQFVTTDLPQPWQTLGKILMRCLSTREIGVDQPQLQMMQIFYCIINNLHVDYAALLWEGLHYSLMHPTGVIPYPRFTKIIVDYIMTEHPDIPKRFDE